MTNFLIFPITETSGIEIDQGPNLDQLLYHVGQFATRMVERYPDDHIWVVLPVLNSGDVNGERQTE